MNVLITGITGLLGSHLAAIFSRDHHVAGIDRHPWWGDFPVNVAHGDLTDDLFVRRVIDTHRPDVIIHCAAMVNVDACERNPDEAHAVNAGVTEKLAAAIPPSTMFVYISTDAVFGGQREYSSEKDHPQPINVYGRSKLEGEQRAAGRERHLIVRTNFYGWSSGRKSTSAEWLYESLRSQTPITLFDDFFFTPIYVARLAAHVRLLVERGTTGLFHVTGQDRVSKYDFGLLMAEAMGASLKQVKVGSARDAGLSAPRPKDISLDSSLVEHTAGVQMPHCRDDLRLFLDHRGTSLSGRFNRDAAPVMVR